MPTLTNAPPERHRQHQSSRGNPRALATREVLEPPSTVCAFERRIAELNDQESLGYSRSKVKRLAYKLHADGVRRAALDGEVRRAAPIPNAEHVVRRRAAHEIDPTYQQAAHNLTCTAEECDRCGRSPKKNGPEAQSAKIRFEAALPTTY